MIVPKHYENLDVLHENTMPYRSYYVPASAYMGCLVHDREASDTNIQTFVIRFLWIRHMYPMKIPAVRTFMNSHIKRIKMHQRCI